MFTSVLAPHPLLEHLVRRLVWGTYDHDGRLAETFRVAEDRTLADVDDAPFVLARGLRVGIPHATELPAELAARWGALLGDYELVQPFAQLGREVYHAVDAQDAAAQVARFVGARTTTGRLLGMQYRGWDLAMGGGYAATMRKDLAGGHSAHLAFSPGISRGIDGDAEQSIVTAALSPGAHPAAGAAAFSEVVRDLVILTRDAPPPP